MIRDTVTHTYLGQRYDVPRRDTFQAKCYRGERKAFGNEFGAPLEDASMTGCQEFVDRVLHSATWLRLREEHGMLSPKFAVPGPGHCWIQKRGMEISDGRGCRFARGGGRHLILPVWARTKPVILHEMAHCLVGSSQGHNWPFCRAYIDLVSMFIGKAWATLLECELKKAGARTRPPKRMTEEAKAALAARGRAALLAYAASKQPKGESK